TVLITTVLVTLVLVTLVMVAMLMVTVVMVSIVIRSIVIITGGAQRDRCRVAPADARRVDVERGQCLHDRCATSRPRPQSATGSTPSSARNEISTNGRSP